MFILLSSAGVSLFCVTLFSFKTEPELQRPAQGPGNQSGGPFISMEPLV